jgi:hypothetical protein
MKLRLKAPLRPKFRGRPSQASGAFYLDFRDDFDRRDKPPTMMRIVHPNFML